MTALLEYIDFWRSGYGRFDCYSVQSMFPLKVMEAPAPPSATTAVPRVRRWAVCTFNFASFMNHRT